MIALLLAPASALDAHTDGELRYIGTLPPDVVVDADGTATDQGFVLDQRLRAGVWVEFSKFELSTEWDLGTGQVAGDTWALPADERGRDTLDAFTLDGIIARRAALKGTLGPVQLEAGLLTSQWGLGMVANDGSTDPLFGRTDFGDRVLRVRMTGRAGDTPIYLTLAGDRVVADDLAIWAQGQTAWQGIASVLWADADKREAGAYFVYRYQAESPEERTTKAWVGDLFASVPIEVGDWTLKVGAEGAGIFGTTDRATTYEAPDEVKVRSAGVALRTSLALPEDKVVAHLRAGWASGDGRPDDGVSSDFTFDRDFDVGMVLFDEFGAAVEAGTVALLSDPANAGVPPDGVETITTEGAFRRVVYVQPAVQVAPIEGLDLRLGLVSAWSTAPVAQPFYSYRAGGVPTNQLDQPTGGYGLGTEVDWAVAYAMKQKVGEDTLRPELRAQGGHAFLADNLGGGRVDLYLLSARLGW